MAVLNDRARPFCCGAATELIVSRIVDMKRVEGHLESGCALNNEVYMEKRRLFKTKIPRTGYATSVGNPCQVVHLTEYNGHYCWSL